MHINAINPAALGGIKKHFFAFTRNITATSNKLSRYG